MTQQAIDLTQFDSETEDYDALPAGSGAFLIASAIVAAPVLALSLAAATLLRMTERLNRKETTT